MEASEWLLALPLLATRRSAKAFARAAKYRPFKNSNLLHVPGDLFPSSSKGMYSSSFHP